jgi:hypothetical protein
MHSKKNFTLLYPDVLKIYRNIILLVVLYGGQTWSLILREERRLRVLENRVLRRIFGPKWDEVTGEWRKLHTAELRDLYSTISARVLKLRRMGWPEHVAWIGRGDLRERNHWGDQA